MAVVKIPYDQLSPEALSGLVEEFVTRESTDYGAVELSLETKLSQVYQQLKSGNAFIVFDEASQTCNIFHKDDPRVKGLGG
ncbi:MAG: YheU family protein [Desulfobacteraceae bacterium]|nr:YheU family protein [Desulfobacteraceae bacterium]